VTSFVNTISAFPEQLAETATGSGDVVRAAAAVAVEPPDAVVFAGMGGSGIAADVVCAAATPVAPVPLVVWRDYDLPDWVSPRTMVVAVSHSGDTEETLSSVERARECGARLAVVTSGGRLADLADADRAVLCSRVPGGTMPRAALGSLVAACAAILDGLRIYPGGLDEVLNAAHVLAWRRDEMTNERSTVHRAAELAAGATPVIHGGGSLGRVAAARWKADLNENAKIPAFATTLPEANHNEVCGWQPGARRYCAVLLRHAHEHPRVARRFDAVRPILEESASGVVDVLASGAGLLAQVLDLAYQGSWASLFLADERGVEPEPINAIDRLKRELSMPEPRFDAAPSGRALVAR
jgi:glucose/mannose-6-phosphate isomerase